MLLILRNFERVGCFLNVKRALTKKLNITATKKAQKLE